MKSEILNFSLSHYELLLPLKKKWETFKLNQAASLNINDQQKISRVLKEVKGTEPGWCCAASVAENLRQAMILFDKYEEEHVPNPAKVNVEVREFKR